MATNIIISSDETVICPKDHHKFSLHQGITRQTMEKYEKEFEEEFKKRQEELTEQIEKDVKRRTARELASKQTEFDEKLAEKEESLKRAQAQAAKAQKDARAKALTEFEIEKKATQDELDQKDRALKGFRERELELLKEKKTLQQAKEDLELENHRKLDQERQKIHDEVAKREAEKSRLKFAELEKKLGDAQRLNEDLTRKLGQGSQQLQGEVLELDFERQLREAFPGDQIVEVSKGIRGADVSQEVKSKTGRTCGIILYENKRTKNWSDGWISKLKSDMLTAKADIGVIVTEALPPSSESFCRRDEIWITDPKSAIPLAHVLRCLLQEVAIARGHRDGAKEKMELLYTYLTGNEFRQRVSSVIDAFKAMRSDLEAERRALTKQWSKREKHINAVVENMAGMVGDVQAISGNALKDIPSLELEAGEEDVPPLQV